MRTIDQLLLGQLDRNIVVELVQVLDGGRDGERIAGGALVLVDRIREEGRLVYHLVQLCLIYQGA